MYGYVAVSLVSSSEVQFLLSRSQPFAAALPAVSLSSSNLAVQYTTYTDYNTVITIRIEVHYIYAYSMSNHIPHTFMHTKLSSYS
jgi:hypothetical protein